MEDVTFQDKPSILVVDDEASVLKAFRREFIDLEAEMFFANSALEGLAILKDHSIDIVISDIMMPVMDGIKFLSVVKDEYPGVVRIFLSGYVETERAVKCLYAGVANDYITKPWDKEIIVDRVNKYLFVKKILNNDSLFSFINSIDKLPSIPAVFQELRMAAERNAGIKEIIEIIERDVVLTARIINISNSAFYGVHNITDIGKALKYVGLNTILDAVLINTLTEGELDSKVLGSIESVCKRSFMVNKCMHKYSTLVKDSSSSNDGLGIIHDIGKIIILRYDSSRYYKIIENMTNGRKKSFYESETELGYHNQTHQEIGAYFMNLWNFPHRVVELTLFHNKNGFVSNDYKADAEKIYNCCRIVDSILYQYELRAESINTDPYILETLIKYTTEECL